MSTAAKGGGRVNCEPAKHVPGAGPGKRVTGAGTHTTSRKAKEEGEVHCGLPPSDHRIAPLCSSTSQLLRRSLTSRARASSATAPRLPDADRNGIAAGQTRDLPVPVQEASARARFSDHAGLPEHSRWRARPYCLPLSLQRRHPGYSYRGSMAGLCPPLPTLHRWPRGQRRTARGRCGSLLLHRVELPPTTPRQSPGAQKFELLTPRFVVW